MVPRGYAILGEPGPDHGKKLKETSSYLMPVVSPAGKNEACVIGEDLLGDADWFLCV